MSKSLEDIIRVAAAKGWLDHTSIVKDREGRGWQVSTPSRFAHGAWAVEINADPVVALSDALERYGDSAPEEPPGPSIDEMLS